MDMVLERERGLGLKVHPAKPCAERERRGKVQSAASVVVVVFVVVENQISLDPVQYMYEERDYLWQFLVQGQSVR